jgi:PEP-CTERM motif
LQIAYLVNVDTVNYAYNFINSIMMTIDAGTSSDSDGNANVAFEKDYCNNQAFLVPSSRAPFGGRCANGHFPTGIYGDTVGFLDWTGLGAPTDAVSTANFQSAGPTSTPLLQTVGVFDNISLDGGTGDTGTEIRAALNDVSNIFFQENDAPPGVPEPATLLLIGSALLGLGVLRRKRA